MAKKKKIKTLNEVDASENEQSEESSELIYDETDADECPADEDEIPPAKEEKKPPSPKKGIDQVRKKHRKHQ